MASFRLGDGLWLREEVTFLPSPPLGAQVGGIFNYKRGSLCEKRTEVLWNPGLGRRFLLGGTLAYSCYPVQAWGNPRGPKKIYKPSICQLKKHLSLEILNGLRALYSL